MSALKRLEEANLLSSPELWAERSGCLCVPFLAVGFERADALSTSAYQKAVDLAKGLVELVPKVPILASNKLLFASEAERQEFYYLAVSVCVSALAYAGRYEEAGERATALRAVIPSSTSEFLRAEVKRRLTLLLVEQGELAKAIEYLTEAQFLFSDLKRFDMAALCVLRRGNVKHLERSGAGAEDYALSIWLGSVARRERKLSRDRADRVSCAALVNLARDLRDSPAASRREILRYIRGVKERQTKPSRLRASVLMVEGMLAAASSAFREAMRLIWQGMSTFADLNAYSRVATCIAEYLSVVEKYEPESLQEQIEQIRLFLENATDERATEWILSWLTSDLSKRRIEELRQEALARSTKGCPARVRIASAI